MLRHTLARIAQPSHRKLTTAAASSRLMLKPALQQQQHDETPMHSDGGKNDKAPHRRPGVPVSSFRRLVNK
jgi:hypothetical protein